MTVRDIRCIRTEKKAEGDHLTADATGTESLSMYLLLKRLGWKKFQMLFEQNVASNVTKKLGILNMQKHTKWGENYKKICKTDVKSRQN